MSHASEHALNVVSRLAKEQLNFKMKIAATAVSGDRPQVKLQALRIPLSKCKWVLSLCTSGGLKR